ncbi:cell division protein DrpB [Phytobacter ursingii]|uniref:Cell division protein DrpB n=1 Tax=Phytobacter ursingii TaxID=1972431 RepID=A0AB35RT36_9ENTR|nr:MULTISPECIES: cell division protein DrpB [Enterobacteriaceae]MDV2865110.1 cell division protein DrpB [Phytobacter ursingii]
MKSARKDEDPEKKIRSPGGKLALWAFWLFCLHFIWSLAQIAWTVNRTAAISAGGLFDAEPGRWILAFLSLLTFGTVGLILGWIAWYTRPRGTNA